MDSCSSSLAPVSSKSKQKKMGTRRLLPSKGSAGAGSSDPGVVRSSSQRVASTVRHKNVSSKRCRDGRNVISFPPDTEEVLYANPTFSLMGPVIKKIKMDRPKTMILVIDAGLASAMVVQSSSSSSDETDHSSGGVSTKHSSKSSKMADDDPPVWELVLDSKGIPRTVLTCGPSLLKLDTNQL